jgi:hypothetical protein
MNWSAVAVGGAVAALFVASAARSAFEVPLKVVASTLAH